MPESIHDLFAKVREHPDFAGGTVFTRQDVAAVIFEPEDGWVDVDLVTDEQLASITDAQLAQSAKAIEGLIFDTGYGWMDAIRDNVDV